MDNGRWVTIRGHRVFIKNTNDYMNQKIRNSKSNKDRIFYHTSNHDFTNFDNAMPRKAIMGGQYGYGHYFFDDKDISSDYGAYSKYQYEVKANVNNWFEAPEKEFDKKIRDMGYNYEKDDIANFLQSKGYEGSIIEHINASGKKWYEYVVYDSKNLKIVNKRVM